MRTNGNARAAAAARRAAAALMGSARSPGKAKASRENGKKGGRPRKIPVDPDKPQR